MEVEACHTCSTHIKRAQTVRAPENHRQILLVSHRGWTESLLVNNRHSFPRQWTRYSTFYPFTLYRQQKLLSEGILLLGNGWVSSCWKHAADTFPLWKTNSNIKMWGEVLYTNFIYCQCRVNWGNLLGINISRWPWNCTLQLLLLLKNIFLSVEQLNFLIVFFSLHISDKDELWSHCDFVPHLFVLVT